MKNQELYLVDFFQILKHNKKLILSTMLLFASLSFTFNVFRKKTYESIGVLQLGFTGKGYFTSPNILIEKFNSQDPVSLSKMVLHKKYNEYQLLEIKSTATDPHEAQLAVKSLMEKILIEHQGKLKSHKKFQKIKINLVKEQLSFLQQIPKKKPELKLKEIELKEKIFLFNLQSSKEKISPTVILRPATQPRLIGFSHIIIALIGAAMGCLVSIFFILSKDFLTKQDI